MRDLERIRSRRSYNVDRQKISIILATGIVVGMTIFTVGLYIGLRKPGDAEAATADPLEQLIASSGEAGQPSPDEGEMPMEQSATLRYHELLGRDEDDVDMQIAQDDVDAPMPVDAEDSPIPMPSSGSTSWNGAFKVPSVPSDSAFDEPARIALPKQGTKGIFTVHVNSFSDKAEAAGYVKQLRKAGYKAFLVEAHSASRGTLYRVRIGPFFSHNEAYKFSLAFEKKEGIPTYIVQRVMED